MLPASRRFAEAAAAAPFLGRNQVIFRPRRDGLKRMVKLQPFSWERLIGMMEKVRECLRRAVRALEAGLIPYAVVDGNAVAAQASRVDEGKIRNTSDADILLRRADLDAAPPYFEKEGFVRTEVLGVPMFLDGPNGKPCQAIHVLLADEKVRPD